jgi:hypothetical protein
MVASVKVARTTGEVERLAGQIGQPCLNGERHSEQHNWRARRSPLAKARKPCPRLPTISSAKAVFELRAGKDDEPDAGGEVGHDVTLTP